MKRIEIVRLLVAPLANLPQGAFRQMCQAKSFTAATNAANQFTLSKLIPVKRFSKFL